MLERAPSTAFVLALLSAACGGGSGSSGSDEPTRAPAPSTPSDNSGDSGDGPSRLTNDDAGSPAPARPVETPDGFTSTLPPLMPGEPIEAKPHEWTWVSVPDAHCMGDDPTGMHFNLGDPKKLAILMEGGGACYNSFTCSLSLAIHPVGATAADTSVITEVYGNNIFNRDDPDNPIRDYSFVFFPYCSGDVFAGASQKGKGYEGRTQQGYYNVQAYLKRLIATFPEAEKVLLTGVSAGGFGAAFNFDQVQEAFGQRTRVYLLDDSGPPLPPKQMSACLQERWRMAWSLDDIMPKASECPECRNARTDVGVMGMVKYLAYKYPSRRMGVISADHDAIIRQFFGFGLNDCKDLDPTLDLPVPSASVPEDDYADGLRALFDYAHRFEGGAEMEGFLIPNSSNHTALLNPGAFKNTVVDGVTLGEWLRRLLEDDPSWKSVGL